MVYDPPLLNGIGGDNLWWLRALAMDPIATYSLASAPGCQIDKSPRIREIRGVNDDARALARVAPCVIAYKYQLAILAIGALYAAAAPGRENIAAFCAVKRVTFDNAIENCHLLRLLRVEMLVSASLTLLGSKLY
jgi:hypothetical protein